MQNLQSHVSERDKGRACSQMDPRIRKGRILVSRDSIPVLVYLLPLVYRSCVPVDAGGVGSPAC
jgi:hypothetical protein